MEGENHQISTFFGNFSLRKLRVWRFQENSLHSQMYRACRRILALQTEHGLRSGGRFAKLCTKFRAVFKIWDKIGATAGDFIYEANRDFFALFGRELVRKC